MSNIKRSIGKILLIGDGRVGKTSLVTTFVTRHFMTSYKPTLGIDIFRKTLFIPSQNLEIVFQFWDLSGQDQFQGVRPRFYRGAVGAILAFSLTERQSFDNLDKWIRESQEVTGKIPIVLAANKNDITSQVVTDDEIRDFVTNHDILSWYRTSAKALSNVDKTFRQIVRYILELDEKAVIHLSDS